MGNDSPAVDGDSKPDVNNNNDNSNNAGSRGKKNKSKHRGNYGAGNGGTNQKGAIPEMPTFKAGQGSSAVTKYQETLDAVVHHASDKMNSYVSDSIRFMELTLPLDVDKSKFVEIVDGKEDFKSPVAKDDYTYERNKSRKMQDETNIS